MIIPNGPVNSEVNLSMYRDDGRVTAETYVGWIEQKYENKKCIRWLKKLKIIVKMDGEHSVEQELVRAWQIQNCFLNYAVTLSEFVA